jgi:hypothetical protein
MTRVTRFRLLSLPVLLLATGSLAAQIGHAPGTSPYRDIRTATAWEAYGGSIMGSGGPIPVGPRDGPFGGVRVLLRARNTVSIGFGVWGSGTERTILDPNATPSAREIGTRDARLLGGEVALQFNLTGGKQWHRLAPFAGVGLGFLKNTSGDDGDPGGYAFGSKFYFAPMAGVRLFLGERLYLRTEARGFTWKVSYPPAYSIEPADDPGTAENPNAINPLGRGSQYVLTPALSVGIGFAF